MEPKEYFQDISLVVLITKYFIRLAMVIMEKMKWDESIRETKGDGESRLSDGVGTEKNEFFDGLVGGKANVEVRLTHTKGLCCLLCAADAIRNKKQNKTQSYQLEASHWVLCITSAFLLSYLAFGQIHHWTFHT